MKRMGDLLGRIEELREQAKRRAEREKRDRLPGEPLPKNVVQLPLWPEPVRAVPNAILRSALFGAVARGRRRYIDGEQIASLDCIEIRYKGERLDQGDLDAWLAVLHAVRAQALGSQCRATSYALLRLMGLSDTGGNRHVLQRRIERLVACAVTVKSTRYTYIGSLIRRAVRDDVTHEWTIEIDPEMASLFGPDTYTLVELAVRQQLAGSPLAQWLHGFYSSHAKPYPMKIETLLKLSGSESAHTRSGRQKVRQALAKVCAAAGWQCEIADGLVRVHKK